VSKRVWTGEEKEDKGILTFPPNQGGTTRRREYGGCLGQLLTTRLGAQHWPGLDLDRITSGTALPFTCIHKRTHHGPSGILLAEGLNRKTCTWLSSARCHGSILEDQTHQAKHTLRDSLSLPVTGWSSHSHARSGLGASPGRSRQAEAMCNLHTTSCPNPKRRKKKKNLTSY